MVDVEQAREEANEPAVSFCLFSLLSSVYKCVYACTSDRKQQRIFVLFAMQGIEWLRLLQLLPQQKETMTTKKTREREKEKRALMYVNEIK